MIKTKLSTKLWEMRREKKLTQDELSKISGINRVSISEYERGVKEPSVKSLRKLADAMGTTISLILADTEKAG